MEGWVRRILISLLAVMLLGTVTGQAAEPIKVGYIATMSGPAASLGRDILDGFNLGVKHAGDTLGGRPVDVIVGDDQLKPDVGVQVASRMLEKDKVDVIVGIVFSNVMMAVAKPITDAGIFLISANAGPSPWPALAACRTCLRSPGKMTRRMKPWASICKIRGSSGCT